MPDNELVPLLLAAFVSLVTTGIGLPPAPEEMVVVGWGVWTGSNPQFDVYRWLMLPMVIAGAVVADVLLYSVGRHFGPRLLEHRWPVRLAPTEQRQRAERTLPHYRAPIP